MPFANEHAARQRDPGGFTRFRRTHPTGTPAGIDFIIGFKSGDGSEVQAVRAAKDTWTVDKFRTWLKDHDFKTTIEKATGNSDRADKLEQRGEEWFVLSEEGEELSGPFENREQAAERLRQIEAAKAARGSTDGIPVQDGETVRRFDFNLGTLHTDESRKDGIFMREDETTGFLRGEARMSRTGVQTYSDATGKSWGEFRDASEVFSEDSLRSFDLAVVTNDHPAEFVNADNRADVDMGSIGTDARPDGGKFVRASLVVRDKKTIADIKSGKRDLSMGYLAKVLVQPGVTNDGTPFAARQTNIRINHGAIVTNGRAGPECGVELARGDAFTHNPTRATGVNTMKTKKIKLQDGTEVVVPVEVADKLEALGNCVTVKIGDTEYLAPKAVAEVLDDTTTVDIDGTEYQVSKEVMDALDQAKKKKKKLPAFLQPDDDDEDKDKSKDSDSALRAKVDVLESQATESASTFNSRVDARSKLVTDARIVLGAEHRVDGVEDADLMRAIVIEAMPTMKDKLDANKEDGGYLRCAYEQAMELHGRRDEAIRDTNGAVFDAINDGGDDPLGLMDALTSYNDRASRAG